MRFRKEERARFLKRLFSYYGFTFVLTVFAGAIWHKHVTLSLPSILPVCGILYLIFMAYNDSTEERLKGPFCFSYTAALCREQYEMQVRIQTMGQYVCLLSVPILFPFIFFFPAAAKIAATVVLFFLPHLFVIIAGIVCDIRWIKQIKKENEQHRREREEQERREEQMDWNDPRK